MAVSPIATIAFTPSTWYWVVAESSTQVYSSAAGNYVPSDDATYQAWLDAGNMPTKIASEVELGAVLSAYSNILAPVPSIIADAYSAALVDGVNKEKLRKLLFYMANQIRSLQGQPALTVAQFKSFWKGL